MRKTSRGPSARPGVRRGNDKYPGWKVATRTAPLGGEVFRREKKKKVEQIQHIKDKKRTHRPAHSPVPRYERTGYPGRPPALGWEGVGRAKLNNDEKATALRLR